MEDYYQDKAKKRKDLLNGVLHNLVVGVVVAGLYFFILLFAESLESDTFRRVFGIAIVVLGVIGLFIYEFIVIRKHLKGRRYIAIGMIIALVLPLLAFGACSPWIIGVDMT